jgi:ferredoxin--NADP+ reductase
VPLPGVPFDERRCTIPNDRGRILDPERDAPVLGEYAVGWIKRGPTGIIGTNKKDAQGTIDNLLADLEAGRIPEPPLAPDAGSIEELLAERRPDAIVSFQDWEAIDAAEKAKGEPLGRPRVKFCRIDEMVETARAGQPVGAE